MIAREPKLLAGAATIDDLDAFLESIEQIATRTETVIQAVNAQYVTSEEHLRRAVELAERAIDRNEAIARDPAVEILLYAAGRRQITDALEMGVGEAVNPQSVVFIVVEKRKRKSSSGSETTDEGGVNTAIDALKLLCDSGEMIGSYDPQLVDRFFSIGDSELRLVDGDRDAIVRERVALLDVSK
ncbi:KEOPS complex subunit Cgi121 [Halalkalirubrum salinum]|uniref:KEOPS complex subunit Cgi121 n=1 Tax=Halalkalirubrum salinum TaxID=2563889 RepID=UPI0010FBA104|nr:KEOPS complex subunit Cgi121 [Halalkalirubrum salinum]